MKTFGSGQRAVGSRGDVPASARTAPQSHAANATSAGTSSGRLFPLLSPSADDVRWRDVAAHLAKICRFNGGVELFYTVAQHSVLAADHATNPRAWDTEDARIFATAIEAFTVQTLFRAVLLHDCEEYVGGDQTRPQQAAFEVECPGFVVARKRILGRISGAIYGKAGLPWPLPPLLAEAVDRADNRMGATEQRDLTGGQISYGCPPIARLIIKPQLPGPAEAQFLDALERAGLDPRA